MVDRFDENRNILALLGLILTVGTVLWYAFKDISVGWTYTLLFLTPSVLLLITFMFIDEKSKKSIISKLQIPFTISAPVGAFMFFVGFAFVAILQFILNISRSQFSFTDFVVPLAAEKTNILIQQTFSQLTVASSRSAELFNTIFTATYIEEFIFGYVMIFVFYSVIKILYRSLATTRRTKRKDLSHNATLIIAILLTGIIFAVIHSFNSTYVSLDQYVVAAIFRILMTSLIYYFGATFSLLLGAHQANNLIWYMQTYGLQTTIEALTSWTGVALLIEFMIVGILVLNNITPFDKFIADVRRELKKGAINQ